MYIILDLGNTNQKAGIFDGEKLIKLEQHDRLSLPLLRKMLDEYPQVSAGIMSSVVHVTASVAKLLQSRLEFFIELTSQTPLPLKNLYKTPDSHGKDRLACAVAASRLFEGSPVLVVNAGTCITYDLVNRRNEYLGGAIAPGLRMRLQAMNTFTGKLPLIELQDPAGIVGNDTQSSILNGAVYGTVAEVREMVRQYRNLEPGLKVILSGGDMECLDKLLKIRIFALPNIVMIGLKYILEYNLQHAS